MSMLLWTQPGFGIAFLLYLVGWLKWKWPLSFHTWPSFLTHPGQFLLVSFRILLWLLYTGEPLQVILPFMFFGLYFSRWQLSISTWMSLGHLRISILSLPPVLLLPMSWALHGWIASPSPYSFKLKNVCFHLKPLLNYWTCFPNSSLLLSFLTPHSSDCHL